MWGEPMEVNDADQELRNDLRNIPGIANINLEFEPTGNQRHRCIRKFLLLIIATLTGGEPAQDAFRAVFEIENEFVRRRSNNANFIPEIFNHEAREMINRTLIAAAQQPPADLFDQSEFEQIPHETIRNRTILIKNFLHELALTFNNPTYAQLDLITNGNLIPEANVFTRDTIQAIVNGIVEVLNGGGG